MNLRRAAALILAGSALLPFAACLLEYSVVCETGDQRACFCDDGGLRGYQTCSSDKSGYGTCACQAHAAATSDVGMDDGSADGGLKKFMDFCDKDEECETGLCFHYNVKPARCSKPCTAAAECPPPATGCNGMGVCKSP